MVIQHNLNALNSRNKLRSNISGLKKSSEKLAGGYRINRAGDDAAGLAVSEKMRGQIRGLDQAVRNSQDGINLIQTFEGALGETVAVIHRAKGLAEQMANGTYDDSTDRNAVELEYLHLCDEADQIAETDFNGIVMLSGKPESAARVAELESRINLTVDNLPETVSETSAQTAALNIDTKTYAASAAAFAAPKAGGVVCGDFTVYGNSSDFSFNTASGVLTILGGDVIIEGTGAATTNTIVVAKDKSANVTLRDINIDVSNTDNACAFKIEDDSTGDVTVTLEGDNTLKSGKNCAGFQKNGDINSGTLTINGNGSLNVYGGINGAGVGGGDDGAGTNIAINSGTVIANGGLRAAGIGGGCGTRSGWNSSDGTNITISGGTVTANGGLYAAGIGGGDFCSGINITISGGIVTASGGEWAAGIGGGDLGVGTNIIISSGIVTANGGTFGAGIGGGEACNGTDITISGGIVTAKGGSGYDLFWMEMTGGAGIGGGIGGSGDVTIKNKETVVIAKGGINAKNIGGGAHEYGSSTIDIDNILTKEPYSGNGIVDGTIVHYTGKKPDTPDPDAPSDPDNPDVPDEPNIPDEPDKFTVSTPDAFGNSTAQLTYINELTLQVGARTKDAVNFTFSYDAEGIGGLNADLNCTAKGLGMDKLTLKTQESANYAIDRLDHALNKVSMIRATFGAAQNRLEHKITNLVNSGENLTEAESAVRDADMASELMSYTKFDILRQAAQSMLAQANQMPQSALRLLE